jgi:hypothetical protein
MKIGANKTTSSIDEGAVLLTQSTEETTVEVTEEVVESFPIYWKVLEVDKEGNMTIKIYGEESKQRFDSLKDTRVEFLNKLKKGDTLARAQAKFDLIDSLITDDKRTRVIPGKSLLFGNNVEVIPQRHGVENNKGEKQVTRTTTRTTRTVIKKETLERREA